MTDDSSMIVPPGDSHQPPAPEMASERKKPSRSGRFAFWGLLGGCLTLFVLLTIAGAGMAAVGTRPDGWWAFGPKVAIVPIEGEIFDSRETIHRLEHYASSAEVKAIVVRINSPGGAVVPSQEIYSAIRQLREEEGKPIIASLDSVAASGGYYIAVACDSIVANPGTITGSIGVIAQWFNMEDLVAWARLEPQTITSGAMKDEGSPYREMKPEERAHLQSIVTGLHEQFIRAVAEGREGKLTEAEVTLLADGRIYTGEEAVALKLIDRIGTLRDAIELAGKEGGIRGTPKTVYPRERQPGFLDLLLDGNAAKSAVRAVIGDGFTGTRFLYRWYQ
ncbi:MAG TPA: signal peptide peptidase SppA [Thermoanaerobaculia bacterium]|nr:signal peptide peptidase SppA [Thermoanaerobaculia bacterium]